TACNGGVIQCVNPPGSTGPTAETCDGKDNDCNGKVDDPFTALAPGGYADGNAAQIPLYNSDSTHCGTCGTSCALAHAVNGCQTDATIDNTNHGVCFVVQCNSDAVSGFNYVPSTCGRTPVPAGPRDGPTGVGCNYACP